MSESGPMMRMSGSAAAYLLRDPPWSLVILLFEEGCLALKLPAEMVGRGWLRRESYSPGGDTDRPGGRYTKIKRISVLQIHRATAQHSIIVVVDGGRCL